VRKIKHPKIGEYVLLTKWRDKDPEDPWCLTFLEYYFEAVDGFFYKGEENERLYNHCFRLTKEEGHEWMENSK